MAFRFLAYSDIHYHDYTFGADVRDRLNDCSIAFEQVIIYALENNIELVLFGGDITHSKKNVTKRVLTKFLSDLEWAERQGITLVMIPGNHDYEDKEGRDHSLSYLEMQGPNDIHVSSSPSNEFFRFNFNDTAGTKVSVVINAIPFTEDKNLLLEKMNRDTYYGHNYKILLAHTGIQDALMGSDYITAKAHDLNAATELPTGYDCCLFGHYHEHQKVAKNAWIIGSTHQMNWSDAGGTRGFCDITINNDGTVTMVHVPTTDELPRFQIVNENTDLTSIRAFDFVKYESKETLTEELKDNIKGQLLAVIGELPAVLDIVPTKKKEVEEEVTLSSKALSADAVMAEWIDLKKTDLDKEKLLALGKELIIQARDGLE